MKAVVMEVKGREAIVLSRDGRFLKIKNKAGLDVGQEIDLNSTGAKVLNMRMFQRAASVAAAFVFTFGLGTGVYAYYTPYSYVNVDINPSIEITANRFDRILKVEAINDDGAKVLEDNNFKNKTLSSAVEDIIKKSAEKGYLKKDDADAVMLTVTGKSGKKIEKVEEKIVEAVKKEIGEEGFYADIIVQDVTQKKQEEAKAMEISPGKLVLIEKLKESAAPAVEINAQEWKDEPVRDIMKEIKSYRKEAKEADKNTNKENKNGNGNIKKDGNENVPAAGSQSDKKKDVETAPAVKNENSANNGDSKDKSSIESDNKKNSKENGQQGDSKGK